MTTDLARLAAELLHHRAEGLRPGDPVAPAIVPASMYHLPGSTNAPYQYGRFHNPTWDTLEAALGHLEQAEVVTFPTGMAAVAAAIVPNLSSGDRLLLPSDGYYTVRAFADRYLKPLGVVIETRPTTAMLDGGLAGVRLVWLETPSNPGLDLCDVAAVVAAARAAGALVAVDNTTMTPLGQRPLDLGADIVVSADTKAVSGHSDCLFGHVASRDPSLSLAAREWRKLSGATPSPFDAFLVHRGLETLEVRFARMCASAATIAERLANHPKVVACKHPALGSHPAHALALRQMTTGGFLIGLTLADAEVAERFLSGCPLVREATSFGGVHTSGERRARWGDAVAPGYVRLSVGCEPTEALWSALADALDAA